MSNRPKLRRPQATTFVSRSTVNDEPGVPRPRWNGQPCNAVKVWLNGEPPEQAQFPVWWEQHLIGEPRAAVRVTYNGHTFYLDNADGSGWAKVTTGQGSPRWPHRELFGWEWGPSQGDGASSHG